MLRLIKAEIVMFLGELKQYYLNYIFYNLGLVTMFIGLFYSFNQDSNQKEAAILLIGLITWQLCTSGFTYFVGVIEDEALMGTLEQIFMTRTSIYKVLFSKSLVTCLFNLLKAFLIFIVCLVFFRCGGVFLDLGVKAVYISIVIVFTLVSFYLLGLFAAGLALFYKRIQSVAQIINYVLLFFANITIDIQLLPAPLQPIGYVVPIGWAMRIVRGLVSQDGVSIAAGDVLGLLLSTVCFGLVGFIGFKVSLKKAKKFGKLGHY